MFIKNNLFKLISEFYKIFLLIQNYAKSNEINTIIKRQLSLPVTIYKPLKNLGYPSRDYQYPPRKDDTEKLMLEFLQKDMVKNIGLSAQVAAYAYLSIEYILTIISMQKNSSINSSYIYFKYTSRQ